ncbi:hypothetical protein [Halolamina sp. C58]|uniref:hypothetical protein n=1 Tax=Halolamina sp. C58 TaxID=3421640 RepID=UPI003EBF808A
MSDGKPTEACGRCSMTAVVDAADVSGDPFDDERIEVDESSVRRVSPAAWMGRVTGRLNAAVQRLTYGK